MIFPSTTDKLELVRSSTADIDVMVEWVEVNTSTGAVTPGRTLTKFNTAATGDIMAAPLIRRLGHGAAPA